MTDGSAHPLYPELIVDHGRRPRHATLPSGATHRAQGDNPLCGDRVTVALVVDQGRIRGIGHSTRGCALCVAAASTMAEAVEGRAVEDSQALAERVRALVQDDEARADPGDLGDLATFAVAARYPARQSCVLLPWQVLCEALTRFAPASGH